MIASFSKNFIFIKTRKTAGTSVEIYLSSHCGPTDIVAPITFEDEGLRSPSEGVLAATNFARPELEGALRNAFEAGDQAEFRRIKSRIRKAGGFYNHMTAKEMHARLPRAFWDAATKITVERHPYEKVVSRAYFDRRLSPETPIDRLIERAVQETKDEVPNYSLRGKIVADVILRQETLLADLNALADRLELPRPVQVSRAKSGSRVDGRPAREILTAKQMAMVAKNHQRTFDLLGYDR